MVNRSTCFAEASEPPRRDAELARYETDVADQRDGFVRHHLANTTTPTSARRTIERRTAELWARRGTHADGLEVSIGIGSVAWTPRLAAAERRR